MTGGEVGMSNTLVIITIIICITTVIWKIIDYFQWK